jgi:hypothetical protein
MEPAQKKPKTIASVLLVKMDPFVTKKQKTPPTLEEFKLMPAMMQIHWECLTCSAPALADARIPGSFCSDACGAAHYE